VHHSQSLTVSWESNSDEDWLAIYQGDQRITLDPNLSGALALICQNWTMTYPHPPVGYNEIAAPNHGAWGQPWRHARRLVSWAEQTQTWLLRLAIFWFVAHMLVMLVTFILR